MRTFLTCRAGRRLFLSSLLMSVVLFGWWSITQQASVPLRDSARFLIPDKGQLAPGVSTIVVNSTADVSNSSDGLCTLREAINAARSGFASGGVPGECAAGANDQIPSDRFNIINFTVTGTINLISELPAIGNKIAINGPGSSQLTIRRNSSPSYRIFLIGSTTVSLSGLTIANGRAEDGAIGNEGGGGIRTEAKATLTLTDVILTGNRAGKGHIGGFVSSGEPGGSGGGIDNAGTLTMISCAVAANNAGDGGSGGAIGPGTGGDGGGINNSGNLTLINSTVSGNMVGNTGSSGLNPPPALTGRGGGISNSGTMTIVGSTISDNIGAAGAGIINGGSLTVVNSTVSGNHTGTAIEGGALRLTNCTITGNESSGINGSNTSFVRNTIVAANGPSDVNGAFNSQGHNLIGRSDGTNGFTNGNNGDQVGTFALPINPRLAPLANNGGPTLTHALLANSPALDAGDNCVAQAAHCSDANISQLLTDQRGAPFNRIVDGPDADTTATIDIGAYETQSSLSGLADANINEDTQFLAAFDGGDTSTVTSVTATSSNPTLVPNDVAHLSVEINGSTGLLRINPAANQSGTANITITINRTGSPENKTFLLTVNSVNDAPSFTRGADQTVNEDAGGQTISNWATNISPGAPDESSQTLAFTATNNNNALFSTQPAVSPTGTLTYTPAANVNGAATISVTLKDSGGTANGGVDTSATQTFTITVNSVNDAPSFTKGADQTVNNNSGMQTVANWATNISAGPSNESSQTLTFLITANTNPSLFATAPAISAGGTLTYQPAANQGGTATLTIQLQDDGGTANGGADKSPAQSFNINVTPIGGFISFNSATSNTTEASGMTTLTVKRTGDLSRPATVDYATSADNGLPCSTANAVATPKCDFTAALGTLSFAAGENTKIITILISQDSYVEGPETFSVSLSNQTGGSALATPATTSITIADDVTEPPENAIDDAGNYVRQHYHDFLNREADQSGLDFWTNQITSCGGDAACTQVRHINVSAAFFLSIEFQQTGYLVERMYKVAYGDATGTSTLGVSHQLFVPVVRFNEFLQDTQRIGRGVVVLQPGWEQVLENNKQAYALEFVQTSRFITAFPTTMTPAHFVDTMNQNAGGVLSPSERATTINLFNSSTDTSDIRARGQAVRQVAENTNLYNFEFNRAFVLTQYFGYLRRNPDDAPEATRDYTGYDFWLRKLNQFNGNYISAEMVKAFISSSEYRQRFGP